VEGRRLLDEDDVERMQERIDAAVHSRALFAAVAQLPDGERAVLELVALDELSVTEAAAVLGVRPVTARVRLHRARGALRRQIFDDDSPEISHPLEAS
jgi:RNA polymerase sigma-70 factor (ECF subfamily)